MNETSGAEGQCPICGTRLPAGARFCPTCGHRVADAPTTFQEAADEGDLFEHAAEQPTLQAPTVSGSVEAPEPSAYPAPPVPQHEPVWTASPEEWPDPMPTSRRGSWRDNRTLWIILAVFGFIVFCCCAMLFALFIAASVDSSFQSEISLAMRFVG